MSSTRRQTQQKRTREQTVRERREQKQAKRRAASAERKAQARENARLPHPTSVSLNVSAMNLAVGDEVVYGPHGVGRITAREKHAGDGGANDLVVLALENGMTVTLRVTKALEQLRPPADEADLLRIEAALRTDCDLPEGPWLSRKKQLQAKLTDSDSVQLAEIVAEGAQRVRLRLAAGKQGPLSPGERSFFINARDLLIGEIAVARGLEQVAAEDWIEQQLGRRGQ